MLHKVLTLDVTVPEKEDRFFPWLHLQRSDIIFLQETYSSTKTKTKKRWETEWGGKIMASQGATHSKGVMILFEPNMNVVIDTIVTDKNGRHISAETFVNETKTVLVNIYARNDPSQQILLLRDLSKSVLSAYAHENLVLAGDFNCVRNSIDKKGGRPFVPRNEAATEFDTLIKIHHLIDSWRQKNLNEPGFTWCNLSMKIQNRFDYLFIPKSLDKSIQECRIVHVPNIFFQITLL